VRLNRARLAFLHDRFARVDFCCRAIFVHPRLAMPRTLPRATSASGRYTHSSAS